MDQIERLVGPSRNHPMVIPGHTSCGGKIKQVDIEFKEYYVDHF